MVKVVMVDPQRTGGSKWFLVKQAPSRFLRRSCAIDFKVANAATIGRFSSELHAFMPDLALMTLDPKWLDSLSRTGTGIDWPPI
jgi:hypothetical protein